MLTNNIYQSQLEENYVNIRHDVELKFEHVASIGGFNVLYLNARNYKAIGRIDALEDFVSRLCVGIDVIVVTETFLKSSECRYYELNGYDSHFECRDDRGGGGVVIYCRTELNAEEITINSTWRDKYFNVIGVSFTLNGKLVDLYGLYRPTEYSSYHMREFFVFLDDFLNNMRENSFVVGDFNIDILSSEPRYCSKEFVTIVNMNAFAVLNQSITRFGDALRNSGSLIDLVLSNSYGFHGQIQTFPLQSMSTLDHEGLLLQLENEKTSVTTKTPLKRYDYNKFLSILKRDDYWVDISSYEQLAEKTSSSLEICVKPVENQRRCAEWVNQEYLNLKRSKDRKLLKSRRRNHSNGILLEQIHDISTKMAILKRQLKESFMSGRVIRNVNNSRRLWESIDLALYRGTKNRRRHIDCINRDGDALTEPISIANVFNEYFCSVGDTLIGNRSADLDKLTNSDVFKRYKDRVTNVSTFELVSCEEIELIITQKIKPGKSPGSDGITTDILRSLVHCRTFIEFFVKISNEMLETGNFPVSAKDAIVIPLHKKGSRKDVANYRPVSLLNSFSKILEHVLKTRLLKHLNENSILHPGQYGFIEKSDTNSAVMDLVSELNQEIDGGKMVAGIFLDLSKAFDLMDHSILVKKLEMYGLRGESLNIFSDYLSSRSQRVRINGILSEPLTIVRGVPQGSVLGPLLFVVYLNDMFDLALNGKIRCYADDTSYFNSDTDLMSLTTNSNRDIGMINEFMNDNLLVVNALKTQLIIFRSHMRYTELDFSNQFQFAGTYLTPMPYVKYLGMTLDCFLKWKQHAENLSLRISPIVGLLYKLRRTLNEEALMTLYHGLINSHLSYMCPIWASGYVSNVDVLNVLQRKAIKNIFGLNRMHPTSDLFATYPIKSIAYLHQYTTVLFIHKNLTGMTHSNIDLPLVSHAHFTRQTNLIRTERFNTNWGRFSIRYNGVIMYNHLPEQIRMIQNIGLFKKRVKEYLNTVF